MNFERVILLSSEQKQTVERIKKWLREDLGRSEPFICDHFIYRYLDARKWDDKKTRDMLKGYFGYRDKMMSRMDEHKERLGMVY